MLGISPHGGDNVQQPGQQTCPGKHGRGTSRGGHHHSQTKPAFSLQKLLYIHKYEGNGRLLAASEGWGWDRGCNSLCILPPRWHGRAGDALFGSVSGPYTPCPPGGSCCDAKGTQPPFRSASAPMGDAHFTPYSLRLSAERLEQYSVTLLQVPPEPQNSPLDALPSVRAGRHRSPLPIPACRAGQDDQQPPSNPPAALCPPQQARACVHGPGCCLAARARAERATCSIWLSVN